MSSAISRIAFFLALLGPVLPLSGCRDVARFSSAGGHYQGTVVAGGFVRTGIAEDARLCVTLDTDHLQDEPGTISLSDGRLRSVALRPIPQIWHDPLSTMSFGNGRVKNLVYMASPAVTSGSDSGDVTVILSLMDSGSLEARLLRGAPAADGGVSLTTNVFGVFTLEHANGSCPF